VGEGPVRLGHPAQVLRAARAFGQRTARLSDLRSEIAERCGFDPGQCRFRVEYVEHHLAHVASSFYLSPHSWAAAVPMTGPATS
jgi:carbamoyltransferase